MGRGHLLEATNTELELIRDPNHLIEQISHNLVAIRRDPDPFSLLDQLADRVRAGERLPRSRWPLDREHASIHRLRDPFGGIQYALPLPIKCCPLTRNGSSTWRLSEEQISRSLIRPIRVDGVVRHPFPYPENRRIKWVWRNGGVSKHGGGVQRHTVTSFLDVDGSSGPINRLNRP